EENDDGDASPPTAAALPLRRGGPAVTWDLGEAHYRRSEESWAEAGRPRARITVTASGTELVIDVRVTASALVMVAADAANPYDNEHPDINGSGVQLYVATGLDSGAWMIVPSTGQREARVRALGGWGTLALHRAVWRPTTDGYELSAHVALGGGATAAAPIALDVLVNDAAPGRERRRGQLVLSGAEGEFVYLRGDRHDPARLVPLVLTD
ncbi:MAG: hypothetical protein ACHQQ3_14125, partial [Gemmatimonadales bacterium]